MIGFLIGFLFGAWTGICVTAMIVVGKNEDIIFLEWIKSKDKGDTK